MTCIPAAKRRQSVATAEGAVAQRHPGGVQEN
jgi:hypothetical protein